MIFVLQIYYKTLTIFSVFTPFLKKQHIVKKETYLKVLNCFILCVNNMSGVNFHGLSVHILYTVNRSEVNVHDISVCVPYTVNMNEVNLHGISVHVPYSKY